MDIWFWFLTAIKVLLVLLFLGSVLSSFETVEQATVGVVQRFGKYLRVARPGLNWLFPFVDSIAKAVSLQQVTEQVEFTVITQDQANVAFQITILIEPLDDSDETIKLMAYKFQTEKMFETALGGAVEASIRSIVAGKKQSEILSLRAELVRDIKTDLDGQLASWGWHLRDMQINSIKFSDEIMESMAKVVAAKNSLSAAEFEGQALLVRKTKEAEAHGRAIVISAESEAKAEQERGRGLAWFREEVGKGIAEEASLLAAKHVPQEVMLFAMWTETLKQIVENGKGNTFFFDGSVDSMQRTVRQLMTVTEKAKNVQ